MAEGGIQQALAQLGAVIAALNRMIAGAVRGVKARQARR